MSLRRSLSWAFSAQLINFTVQFAGSVLIARLLSPVEMGIVAIAMAALGLVSVFTAFGVGSYVVRDAELTANTLDTAFTVNATMAIVLSLVLLALSAGTGWVLGEPRAGAVLRVVAVTNVLGIVAFRPSVMMQREMQFKRISLIAVVAATTATTATVAFAWTGASYMSAAYGGLIGQSLGTGLTVLVGRRHTSFSLSVTGWRAMTAFGLQLMSVGGVALLVGRLCDLILGRQRGVAALGLYSRANSTSGLIFENIYGTAARIVFVQLSKDYRETGELRPVFLRSFQIITAVMWPLLTGFAILSGPAVLLLYGEKWLRAAGPLSILLIAQVITLAFGMNWELFVLRGETARQTRYEMTRSATGLALFTIGCHFGLAAAAGSRIIDSVVGLILYAPHVRRLANLRAGEMGRSYRDGAILTMAAAWPALMLMTTYRWSANTPLALVFGAVGVGVACWAIAIAAMRHPIREEAVLLLQRRWNRRALAEA